MQRDSTQHPRQFVLLGRGPWLRPSPIAQRICGVVCLGALGVMVVAAILGPRAFPLSTASKNLFLLFLGAGVTAFLALWGFVACWNHDSNHQYCPDCLQYMTRGARVCPYCGLRDDQASTSAAASARRPPLSA
jgi:hypothetical protein